MKRCVSSLERNIGKDEFRVSGGSEFQSREPMTDEALHQVMIGQIEWEERVNQKDLVETELVGNGRLL